MNIGVDIDGTLNNVREMLVAYANYYDMTIVKGIGAISPNEYNIKDVYGWTDEQYKGFMQKYLNAILMAVVPKPFCIAVLDKLMKEGNNIYIISDRNDSISENIVQITQNWLVGTRIPYNKLLMDCNDKLEVCKAKNLNLIIDDYLENWEEVAKEIPVICFNEVYNKDVENDNIIRAYDWIDVYRTIQKMRWQ